MTKYKVVSVKVSQKLSIIDNFKLFAIKVIYFQVNYYLFITNFLAYSLTWKEASGPWQEAWSPNKLSNLSGVQKHALTGLKCGTKYSLRITATNKVGTSQPAYIDVSTLGGRKSP